MIHSCLCFSAFNYMYVLRTQSEGVFFFFFLLLTELSNCSSWFFKFAYVYIHILFSSMFFLGFYFFLFSIFLNALWFPGLGGKGGRRGRGGAVQKRGFGERDGNRMKFIRPFLSFLFVYSEPKNREKWKRMKPGEEMIEVLEEKERKRLERTNERTNRWMAENSTSIQIEMNPIYLFIYLSIHSSNLFLFFFLSLFLARPPSPSLPPSLFFSSISQPEESFKPIYTYLYLPYLR